MSAGDDFVVEGAAPGKSSNSAQNRGLSSSTWKRFPVLLIPLMAVALLYWPAVNALIIDWNDTQNLTYTHGWLILLVSLWLLWQICRQTTELRLAPSLAAAAALLFLGMAWLLAARINIQLGQTMLLPIIGLTAIWAAYGLAVARVCTFALSYLYFAIPFWGDINGFLQWSTIFAVRILIRIFGIPAYFVDNTVHLPVGVFAVEGGCSGLHFFIVALALAALYAHLHKTMAWMRLMILAAMLAMVANWVRVLIIIIAGHLTHMQSYLVRVSHYGFGWCVFAVTMVMFFVLAARFKEAPVKANSATDFGMSPSSAIPSSGCALALSLLAVVGAPIWQAALLQRPGAAVHAILLPRISSGWMGPANDVQSSWHPVFEGADAHAFGRYQQGASTIDVFVAEYRDQRQGKKLAGYHNSLWSEEEEGHPASDGSPPGQFARQIFIDAQGRKALLWYSYYVGERRFTSALKAQVYYGVQSLFTQPLSGVIALRTPCQRDCVAAARSLAELAPQVDSVGMRH